MIKTHFRVALKTTPTKQSFFSSIDAPLLTVEIFPTCRNVNKNFTETLQNQHITSAVMPALRTTASRRFVQNQQSAAAFPALRSWLRCRQAIWRCPT
jgi:hypothetical protein